VEVLDDYSVTPVLFRLVGVMSDVVFFHEGYHRPVRFRGGAVDFNYVVCHGLGTVVFFVDYYR
jgi:hypothetical protein